MTVGIDLMLFAAGALSCGFCFTALGFVQIGRQVSTKSRHWAIHELPHCVEDVLIFRSLGSGTRLCLQAC